MKLQTIPPLRAIPRPVPTATIFEIREAARDLAVRIEAGLFAALDADTRCDLRALTITMAGWADDLEGGNV